MIKINPIVSTK